MMRRAIQILVCLCLTILFSTVLNGQEKDSISSKEEVLLASDLFQASSEELRLMILKPRFKYINKEERLSFLKIGYRPGFGRYPNRLQLDKTSHNLAVAFEKKTKNAAFSWNLETITRLHRLDLSGFDYKYRTSPESGGRVGNDYLTNGKFYTHRLRLHASVRHYYNLKSRIEAEVSGNNLAAEYFFIRLRDVLAYSEINELEFSQDRQLSFHKRRRQWLIQPNYFSVGWGIQRPFLQKGLLDFNMEIGKKLHRLFDQEYAQKNFVIDVNLFIGLGF